MQTFCTRVEIPKWGEKSKEKRGGERERFLGHIHKKRNWKNLVHKSFHFFVDLSYVFDNGFQSFQFLFEKENRFSCNNSFALTSLNVKDYTK